MDRASGLGASEIAAVLGWSPHKQAIDIWCEKCGFADPPRESAFTGAGKRLEPVVADWYLDDMAAALTPVTLYSASTVRHPRLPFLYATPDRMVAGEHASWPLECKNTSQIHAREWGTPGTDLIPAHYLAQVDLQMACLGVDRADVAVLIGGWDFRRYTVVRDADEEAWMLEQAEKFWRDHVEPKKPPVIDGSAASLAYLEKKHPAPIAEKLRTATIETNALAARYRVAADHESKAALELAQIRAQLCDLIGDAAGIEGDGYEVTWRKTRDARKIDWEKIAMGLQPADPVRFRELVDAHTSMRPGGRRFVVRFEERD